MTHTLLLGPLETQTLSILSTYHGSRYFTEAFALLTIYLTFFFKAVIV